MSIIKINRSSSLKLIQFLRTQMKGNTTWHDCKRRISQYSVYEPNWMKVRPSTSSIKMYFILREFEECDIDMNYYYWNIIWIEFQSSIYTDITKKCVPSRPSCESRKFSRESSQNHTHSWEHGSIGMSVATQGINLEWTKKRIGMELTFGNIAWTELRR